MATRIVISDPGGPPGHEYDHANAIKGAISFGYGSDIASQIEMRIESFDASIAYAQSIGAIAVVRSTTGVATFISKAQSAYPDIQSFVPLGSNDPNEQITNPPFIPVIITSGAGDSDNDTAYGPGLEFWDDDDDGNPNTDASSFSNGTICGKLLKIKDTLNCSWWQARYRARRTASNNGLWDQHNGFGKVSISAAIAFSGLIPADAYSPPIAPQPIGGTIGIGVTYFGQQFLEEGQRIPCTQTAPKSRLEAYLARFIDTTTEVMCALLSAISLKTAELGEGIVALRDAYWTYPGIKLEADDWKILRSGKETEAQLQSLAETRFAVHQARGTIGGVRSDIRRVSNDPTASIQYLDELDTGWWLDHTYPGHGRVTFLDVGKIAIIDMQNLSTHSDAALKKIIAEEIMP